MAEHRFPTRRTVLVTSGAAALSAGMAPALIGQTAPRVVVLGGGWGGASAARALRMIAPDLHVTLIDANASFVSCPFSNRVLGGLAPISSVTFGYDGLTKAGVEVVIDRADGIDPEARIVRLGSGADIPYDRLIVSPGIDLKWDAIPGYDQMAADKMPHAWKAGAQTELLRAQLEAMEDGGTVIVAPPTGPMRCPPGPYERTSLIAHYLKAEKPASKILVIDAKDSFSKQPLFEEGWAALYGDMIEFVPFSMNGGIFDVDPAAMTVTTAFETFTGDVVNIIPPQQAASIARDAGLAGDADWCEIDGLTFESRHIPGVHVLGDAAVVGDMPKSGFAAHSQAEVCATAVATLLKDGTPDPGLLMNTCYSLVAPDWGISVAGVYRSNGDGYVASLEGGGGTSPLGAGAEVHAKEADFARSWFHNMAGATFGTA